MTTTAKDLWDVALGELELLVTRPNFATWLQGTQGVHLKENEFTVGVSSPFVAEWLEKRMYSLIQRSLSHLLKRPVEVRFVVGSREAPPFAKAGHLPEPAGEPEDLQPATISHPLTAHLNPKFRFDTFIVGKSNRLAYAATCAVAEAPGKSFNPLYLYSGVGLGKTHLLQAVANQTLAHGLKALYVSAEQFTNEFIKGLKGHQLEQFREKYQNLDVLLIDDIQFFAGKQHTQRQFFHIYNELHNAQKQIVLASDRAPHSLSSLNVEEPLISRFQSGLIADIQSPDLELRLALLHAKAKQLQVHLSDDVFQYIAGMAHANVRELEGVLTRIVAAARANNLPLTVDTVSELLAGADKPHTSRTLTPDSLLQAVCSHSSVSMDELRGSSRERTTTLARQIAMYLLQHETSHSLSQIGNLLGGRTANTVLHGIQKIKTALPTDTTLRSHITHVYELLQEEPSPLSKSA